MSKTRILWVSALLCLIVGCAHAAPSLRGTSQIEGHWRSERAEALPAMAGDINYLVRDFTFVDDRWSIEYWIYDDEHLQVPLLSGRNEGRYSVSPVQDAAGQSLAEFGFERRMLTPRSQRFAEALTASGCGQGTWQLGHTQSVIDAGCEPFRVFKRSVCGREYDIIKLQDGRLFLGARPADGFLCAPDRRPTRSGEPLMRVVPHHAGAATKDVNRSTGRDCVAHHANEFRL